MIKLLILKKASELTMNNIEKNIATLNISYFIQYWQIKKIGKNSFTQVALDYYKMYSNSHEINYKKCLNKNIQGISEVLKNCKRFFADDYNVFLVANDKYNMYPTIAENAGMKMVNQFNRPVLNRTEKDKTAYSETIFHLKSI